MQLMYNQNLSLLYTQEVRSKSKFTTCPIANTITGSIIDATAVISEKFNKLFGSAFNVKDGQNCPQSSNSVSITNHQSDCLILISQRMLFDLFYARVSRITAI